MGTIKLKLPTSESKLKVSSASSNITINTNSSYTSRLTFLNFIKIISLNSLVYTISITILQLYLITNRLRLLADLSSYMSNSPISSLASSILATNVDPKLNNSIVINAFLITFSLLFTLLHLVIGSVRIGIYSHDGFKLGTSLDRSHKSLDIDINKNELNSSLTTGTSDEGSKSSSKKGLTKNESKPFGLSSFECCRFRTPKFWPQLPPLGACFHLISAIFLLIAEVQLNSKRIQLGHKPIGDIFSTKLDFMLGEPIIRLQQAHSMKTAQEKETNLASTTIAPNSLNVPSGIQDIIHSKDDFSVFNSGNVIANDQGSMASWQSSSNLMTSNTIGLDYLNLVIALVVFAVKVAQTFWNSSRQFSTLILFYCLNVSSLMAVSYCSYEILFKANNLQKIAKQLLYLRASKIFTNEQGKSNGNSGTKKFDSSSQAKMNLIEDYGHDLISTILFLLSSFILFLNCYIITRFGYKKFNELKSKFELGMNKHLLINNHLKSVHLSNQSENSKCGEKAGKQNINSVNECSSLASSPKQEKASLDRSMSSDSSSSDDLSKSSMSSSDESSSSSKKAKLKSNIRSSFSFLNKGKKESKPRSCSKLNCSSSYCEHLLSTGLLLVYCLLRSLFIFEIFIVFKYSNDILFIITILLELLTILVWILTVILLTVKNEWSFRLSSDYKLVYWDWMHKQNSISSFSKPVVGNVYTESKETFKTSQHNDFNKSNSLIINEYGIEDKKEKIEFEPNIVELKRNSTISLAPRMNNLTTSDVFEKSAGLEKSSSSNFLSNNYSCSQFTTTTTNNMNQSSSNTNCNNKNNGLLVRDDSILLNRSNNMSTSSITEVSSLMPSVCGNLAMSNKQLNQSFNSSFNSNPNKKPTNANILNASSLSASLNPKMINQQFKERQSIADYNMFFNNSMSDKNPYIVNANNQHVDTIDDKNETILSDEFDENYKRLRLNNRSNRSSKIIEAGDFNIEQMSKQAFFYDTNINYQNKKIDNDRYEAADSEQQPVKLRAHSSRPLPMNKQVSFGNSSLRISNPNMMQIKTVGEIMEQDAANVQHHAYIQNQSKIVQNSSIKAKIIHKQSISINDSSSSSLSSATADSGMDSIVDSPTNNQSIKQQSNHGLILNQNQGLLTAKPFLLGVNSPSAITIETNVDNKNNFGSNQVTVIQAAHFLDTRC